MKPHAIMIITHNPHLRAQLKAAVSPHPTVEFDSHREAGVGFRNHRIIGIVYHNGDDEDALDWAKNANLEHQIPTIVVSHKRPATVIGPNIKIVPSGNGYLETIRQFFTKK